MNWILGPLREGIMTVLIVAGPIILAASALGLLIGVLQTATQIQDQTLPSALKLIAVLLLLIFLGMWMFNYITNFTEKTIGRAFSMVISNRQTLLSPASREGTLTALTNTNNNMPLPSLQSPTNEASPNGFIPPPPSFTSYSSPAPTMTDDFSNFNNTNYNSPPQMNNSNNQMPNYAPTEAMPNYPPAQTIQQNTAPRQKSPTPSPKPKQIINTNNYSNKVNLSSGEPEPLPIMKPKLPNQENSSLSLGSSPSDAEGDKLPKPQTNNNSSSEWW